MQQCAFAPDGPTGRCEDILEIAVYSDEPVLEHSQPAAGIVPGVLLQPRLLSAERALSFGRSRFAHRGSEHAGPMSHPIGVRPAYDELARECASFFHGIPFEE